MKKEIKKTILVIFDGFGINPKKNKGNAITEANTPTFDMVLKNYPHSKIETSGKAVGLPEGQMGNSEIGHMNIGAGRIIYSDIEKISKSFHDNEFQTKKVFTELINTSKEKNNRLHLFGLLSNGGVHSHIDHLKELLKTIKNTSPNLEVFIHAFLDGRDTAPQSGIGFVKEIIDFTEEIKFGSLATIIGRYYIMDRDKRWERVKQGYQLLTEGVCEQHCQQQVNTKESKVEVLKIMQDFYDQEINDEFMKAILVNESGILQNDDSVLFFNFRSDRAREVTMLLTQDMKDFNEFDISKRPKLNYVTMTEYKEDFNLPILFPAEEYKQILGQVIADNGLRQLRTAETEKYAHVTFFFNGGQETPFKNEDRILVNSPDVATYDLQPEMSAYQVKDNVLKALQEQKYKFILVNFANGDMVGHTGILEAAIKAVETLDACLKEIIEAVKENNYQMLLTADHGNCEQMFSDDGKTPFTQHTTYAVPLVYIAKDINQENTTLKDGKLADLAPTILSMMRLEIPRGKDEMTGDVLIV